MNKVSFSVKGIPTPKGSFTRMPNGKMIPAGTKESRHRMTIWNDEIQIAAIRKMDGRLPFVGPIRLMVEFCMPVPTTVRKYEQGWLPHTKQPDVDKLFRMLGDALTGIVWKDDSQVCASAISKCYAWDGITGAHVDVTEYDEEFAKRVAEATDAIRKKLDNE
jgi:Holliday junction resolvase RusA-like endonuclease